MAKRKLDRFHQLRSQLKTEKLKNRFDENRSFCQRNKNWRRFSALFTWCVNAFSYVTAFGGAWWACTFVTSMPALSAVFAAIFLGFLIWAQRQSSDRFWDDYWSQDEINVKFLALSVSIVLFSAGLSGLGIYQGIQGNAVAAKTINNDPTLSFLQDEVKKLDDNINASKKTTWKGKITRKSQSAIKEYSKTQGEVMSSLLDRMKLVNDKNMTIEEKHNAKIRMAILVILIIYILLEFGFEAGMSFNSQYDYREFLEGNNSMSRPAMGSMRSPSSAFPLSENRTSPMHRPIGFKMPETVKKNTRKHLMRNNWKQL